MRLQKPDVAARWLLRLDDPVCGALEAGEDDGESVVAERVCVHASLSTLVRLVVGTTHARTVRECRSPDHDALALDAVDPASAAERTDAFWSTLSRLGRTIRPS